MMTEDELRDRMREASADFAPSGDLLESLADRHARRHKRVRQGLVGGTVAATAMVLALFATLFDAPEVVDPATLSEAEIIAKAREADAAAHGMILNFTTDMGEPTHKVDPAHKDAGPALPRMTESWALRAERLGRSVWPGTFDTIVTPDRREQVDYRTRKVITYPGETDKDVVSAVSASGTGDPGRILANDKVRVLSVGAEIHLSGESYGTPIEVWLDRGTFRPVRAVHGALKMEYRWLPATTENRGNLGHVVPPDFQRETVPPPAGGTGIPTSAIDAVPSSGPGLTRN